MHRAVSRRIAERMNSHDYDHTQAYLPTMRLDKPFLKFVHYGCGTHAPDTWTNFDASLTLRLERLPLVGGYIRRHSTPFPRNVRYGNIVHGLSVQWDSCEAVYCSHVLEHLALEDLRRALRNTWWILKPGGTFRMVLPDLEYLARTYLASDDTGAASTFMRKSLLGRERNGGKLRQIVKNLSGTYGHQWMWDYKGLEHELRAARFVSIRRARFGDASIAQFADVEEPSRWENALGIECRKPGW